MNPVFFVVLSDFFGSYDVRLVVSMHSEGLSK
jgi:hypothetical protein